VEGTSSSFSSSLVSTLLVALLGEGGGDESVARVRFFAGEDITFGNATVSCGKRGSDMHRGA